MRVGAGFCANYNSAEGLRVVWRGGNLNNGRNAGRSYSNCNNTPSNANANRGSRRSLNNSLLRTVPLAAGGNPHAGEPAGRNEPLQHLKPERVEGHADVGGVCG